MDLLRLADPSGTKRSSEVSAEQLQGEVSRAAPATPSTAYDALVVSNLEDIVKSLGEPHVHPLVHLYHQACVDRQNPLG